MVLIGCSVNFVNENGFTQTETCQVCCTSNVTMYALKSVHLMNEQRKATDYKFKKKFLGLVCLYLKTVLFFYYILVSSFLSTAMLIHEWIREHAFRV